MLAAVVVRDGRFLLGRRPAHKRHGGLWEFPGGKIHEGESDRTAAARELREELGLTLTGLGARLYTAPDPGSPYVIEFVEVAVEGEPRALEHAELRWCAPSELAGLSLAPSDARFVRYLGGA